MKLFVKILEAIYDFARKTKVAAQATARGFTESLEVLLKNKHKKNINMTSNTVLISYASDDPADNEWVWQLADRLEKDGIKVTVDRYNHPPYIPNHWYLRRSFYDASKVIIVFTPSFIQGFESNSKFKNEFYIINNLIHELAYKNKLIPILRHGTPNQSLPIPLHKNLYLDFTETASFEKTYKRLIEIILTSSQTGPPPETLQVNTVTLEKDVKTEISIAKDSLLKTVGNKLLTLTQKDKKNYSVNVFYGTNRQSIHSNGKITYNNQRITDTNYGTCEVSIPTKRKVGKIPRPHWWKLEFEENITKHVVLYENKELDKKRFFDLLTEKIQYSQQKDAFIFIHGYNVTFGDAARRTAQMAFDLGFTGAPIMYSWASKGKRNGYLADEDTVQFSNQNIIQFLKDVKLKVGAKKLHLIAHSMGNRALTRALIDLQNDNENPVTFNQIILAAPDIDAEVFVREIAPKLPRCSERTTLYASSNDKALTLSRKIRADVIRAGESGKYIVCTDGIDTIDASKASTDFFGHSYFAEAKDMIHDVFMLLTHNHPPKERNLLEISSDSKLYWTFK